MKTLEESWERYVNKRKNEKLMEAEDFFLVHKGEFQRKFLENLDEICEAIVKQQESGKLPSIAYLEYTLLYYRFLKRDYTAEVRVYGEDWYLDRKQTVIGSFDVSLLFGTCTELWEELLSARKRYSGRVSAKWVKGLMAGVMPSFYAYVTSAIRFSILSALEGKWFPAVKKADQFELNVGQYMGNTEAVYKENKKKDKESFRIWFRQRLELEYAFEDVCGMDFSGEDLSEIDFRYSDLRHTVLKGTDFQDAMLFGARFCYADLEGADLRYCMLNEADFTGANLRNVRFDWVSGDAGIPDRNEWEIVGYQGVSFRNADLQGASFRNVKLFGADFCGANLFGAIFDKEEVEMLCLDEEQRREIITR